ncbi:MAG: methyltransferase domain-containing protein [Desulfitobacteriaceae bacterium]
MSEVNHKNFLVTINELLLGSYTLLDVGCGVGATLKEMSCPVKIGVDAYRPYLVNAVPSREFIKIHLAAEHLSEIFLPNSLDCVTLIDVIEHFEKEVALSVLSQAEAIATQKVIVFTPRGFFRQEEVDHYGLGGESFQRHRSGWEVADFQELGYDVIIFKRFHDRDNVAFLRAYGEQAEPLDALLAWKDCNLGAG